MQNTAWRMHTNAWRMHTNAWRMHTNAWNMHPTAWSMHTTACSMHMTACSMHMTAWEHFIICSAIFTTAINLEAKNIYKMDHKIFTNYTLSLSFELNDLYYKTFVSSNLRFD
jgi:hypothetical protein